MERGEIRGQPLHPTPHYASLHAGYLLLAAIVYHKRSSKLKMGHGNTKQDRMSFPEGGDLTYSRCDGED